MRKMRLHPKLKVGDAVEVKTTADGSRWESASLLKAYPRARGQGQWMVRVNGEKRARFFWEIDVRTPTKEGTQ